MPPHCTKSTNPEAQRLMEAMTNYHILFETCSQCVRTLPNRSQHYEEAVERWQHSSEFYRPSWADEAARARFFFAVDKACKTESGDPEKCVLISPYGKRTSRPSISTPKQYSTLTRETKWSYKEDWVLHWTHKISGKHNVETDSAFTTGRELSQMADIESKYLQNEIFLVSRSCK